MENRQTNKQTHQRVPNRLRTSVPETDPQRPRASCSSGLIRLAFSCSVADLLVLKFQAARRPSAPLFNVGGVGQIFQPPQMPQFPMGRVHWHPRIRIDGHVFLVFQLDMAWWRSVCSVVRAHYTLHMYTH